MAAPVSTPAAAAAERTISFYNMHTQERLTVTYKKDGRYDPAAMDEIDRILRDWRRDKTIRMDPELIDLIYTVHEELGSKQPIGIISGYRSPLTNAALRRRSEGVAKHSQHTKGKAIDVYFPDVPLERLREAALVRQRGGVGYYPRSGRPFVHIDTGRVRHWPRMPRQQLARLFPDGDTLHIPADGRPLARKVKTQGVRIARADAASPELATPPGRPIVVARADASAPVPNSRPNAASSSDSGVSFSLFGFKAVDEPAAAADTPQGRLVAGLQSPTQLLPRGSSAPIPTPRPAIDLADGGGDRPLTTASLPRAAPGEDKPARRPMELASLGPAVIAPAPEPERPVVQRAAIGIWAGGLSYRPPAVEALVAHWRVHGEAFAALTAPDQMHLDALTRAPAQSLSISFVRDPAQAPYAEAFVGAAVERLKVADAAPPLFTASR